MFIVKEIAQSLLHLHSKNISHGDLKLENVLLNDKKFKLCDFGSASKVKSTLSDLDFEGFEKYTTLMYRPPEMIDKYLSWPVTTKVDIWVSPWSCLKSNLLDARLYYSFSVFRTTSFPRLEPTCHSQRRLLFP